MRRLLVCFSLPVVLWIPRAAGAESAAEPTHAVRPSGTEDPRDRIIRELLERVRVLEERTARDAGGVSVVPAASPAQDDYTEDLGIVQDDLDEIEESLEALDRLHGYYDFEYFNDDRPDSPGEFRQHHLALLITEEHPSWRLFGEIEFEYGTFFEGDGNDPVVEAQGEVKLEQAWAEYVSSDRLLVRVGQVHTPGYATVHQWPNLWVATRIPQFYKQMFPEVFVGIMVHGTQYWTDFGATYRVYVANGVSAYRAKHDLNENKAVGGQLMAHLPTGRLLDRLDLAIDGYAENTPEGEETRTWGLEAQLKKDRLSVVSEWARKNGPGDPSGVYVLPSFRLIGPWTAYYQYEETRTGGRRGANSHALGVNFKPAPEVALKLEWFRWHPEDASNPFNGVAASTAISF